MKKFTAKITLYALNCLRDIENKSLFMGRICVKMWHALFPWWQSYRGPWGPQALSSSFHSSCRGVLLVLPPHPSPLELSVDDIYR